ncbi:DUF5655 domain-containing protein [Sphaerochaeta sp. UBA5856]|uniref:DUF5655 domain-containing protein n=1 Tax=Sphaerochaeta sp. UBA5856 TaxID=1947476 RepID=UPI0025CC7E3F|nr:DUF5655 domain-containing protein [Sphaerochaeta sp. UBA5856]
MTAEQFFERFPHSLALYTSVEKALKALGPYRMRVSKSQIAFLAYKPFAYVWVPERYQRGNTAPLVLSLPLSFRDETVLWKEVHQVRKSTYMHHKELWTAEDLDQKLMALLAHSYQEVRSGHA